MNTMVKELSIEEMQNIEGGNLKKKAVRFLWGLVKDTAVGVAVDKAIDAAWDYFFGD